MGLDMYTYSTAYSPDNPIDFEVPEGYAEDLLVYWRKHPNLHGWMQRLYAAKGGDPRPSKFNCATLLLTPGDIDELDKAVSSNSLPETSGFFFGQSPESAHTSDEQFIRAAREAHAKGLTVYYTSWW